MDVPPPPQPPRRRNVLHGIRYRTSVPPQLDDNSTIPEEWGLRCPKCDYNLTGLTGRVCPECGHLFDPHTVWRAQRDKKTAETIRTPAYIPYGVLAIAMFVGMIPIQNHPQIALPLLILPIYEAAARLLDKDASKSRTIVIVLTIMTCILWWSML